MGLTANHCSPGEPFKIRFPKLFKTLIPKRIPIVRSTHKEIGRILLLYQPDSQPLLLQKLYRVAGQHHEA